jgi:hypothetical protein
MVRGNIKNKQTKIDGMWAKHKVATDMFVVGLEVRNLKGRQQVEG